MSKRVAVILAIVCVVAVLVPAAVIWGLGEKTRRERLAHREVRAATLDRAVALWKEDQAALKDHWLFAAHDGPDASKVFSTRVAFRGPNGPIGQTKTGLPESTRSQLDGLGDDWAAGADEVKFDGVDFA